MVFNTFEFLRYYQDHPCLWNKNIPDFRNRQKRDAAEEQLLPISGLSNIKQLRAKIRSIRGTYNQELCKIKKSMSTGSLYTPKLNWFTYADSFLRKNDVKIESKMIFNDGISTDEESNIFNYKEHEVTDQVLEQDILLQTQSKTKTLQKSKKSNNTKLSKIVNSLDEAVKALKEVNSSSYALNNEFTLFGQLIAIQLAQLPLEEAIRLQQEILNKINESRLQLFRN